MVPAHQIIQLSSRAFWDMDVKSMDYEQNADYIIRKVFDRGSLEDVAEVLAYYSRERVKTALITAPSLLQKTIYFASRLLDIPLSSFQCSKPKL